MKAKPLVTALLLAFVAISVGYLVLRESRTSASSAAATAPASVGPAATPPASGPAGAVTPAPPAPDAARFVAYYFHGTRRCRTCLRIQQQSQEAIQTGLAEELRQRRLAWLPVNIEEPGNEHFATEYQVTGSTLVVAEVKDGKPARFAKLDRTWDLVNDKPAFVDYVATEVMAFIGSKR
ncbi:MAG: hypothetical protein HY906_15295 [Deltaproteobacteria bacterium]|nr:hypothetical protein [Deltaproteobacteria bacterium]